MPVMHMKLKDVVQEQYRLLKIYNVPESVKTINKNLTIMAYQIGQSRKKLRKTI
jgi:hypothetical protein